MHYKNNHCIIAAQGESSRNVFSTSDKEVNQVKLESQLSCLLLKLWFMGFVILSYICFPLFYKPIVPDSHDKNLMCLSSLLCLLGGSYPTSENANSVWPLSREAGLRGWTDSVFPGPGIASGRSAALISEGNQGNLYPNPPITLLAHALIAQPLTPYTNPTC